MSRRPKRLLEDSIDRVLEVMRNDAADAGESDHIEGDFEGMEEDLVSFLLGYSWSTRKACFVRFLTMQYQGYQWNE